MQSPDISEARDPVAAFPEHGDLIAALQQHHVAAAARPDEIRIVRAPGRVNLIGEHTDYNDGYVLPAAIDLGVSIAFVPADDGQVLLTRLDTGELINVRLDEIGAPEGTWADYVAGTALALREAGARIQGFHGVLAGDLPIGAGLSSSAALELATAWALGGGAPPLDPLELARAAQKAENEYVGVPCGLMDQFAVAMGVQGAALLLDCRSGEHETVPLPDHVEVLICHSGVSRRLRSSGYARRRAECARAVAQIRRVDAAVASLRDVDGALLERAKVQMDDVAYRRARHVISENARVTAVVAALRSGAWASLGPTFAASHASLRDDFEVSTPELDRLVELASTAPGVLGARLTGAGFGGATIALVDRGAAPRVVALLRRDYRAPDGSEPTVQRVRAAAGAGLVWPSA